VLKFPKLGDESFAVGGPETTQRPGGAPSTVIDDSVYVRDGSYVVTVNRTAPSRNLDELRNYATRALARLEVAATRAPATDRSSGVPPGYHSVTDSNAHLSVAVPDSWIAYLPTKTQQQLRLPKGSDPQIKALVRLAGSGKHVLALRDGTANATGGLTFDQYTSSGGCPPTASIYERVLRSIGASQVEDIRDLAYPTAHALEATYVIPGLAKSPSPAGTYHGVVGCLYGGKLFFTFSVKELPVPEDTLATIVSSVRQTS
jgi:hypothetical protein